MARFIAIPVAQGDAFYLETEAGSVLVDGGRSVVGFPDLFRTYTRRNSVDVLVATHNDADHANGVAGFLLSDLECNEVWLPGRWAQVLPHVLRPWEQVVHVLAEQVLRYVETERMPRAFPRDASMLETYAETAEREYGEKADPNLRSLLESSEHLECDESGWPVGLMHQLEAASEEDDFWALPWPEYWWPRLQYRWLWRLWLPDDPRWALFREAIVAAKRIRDIALGAYHRGIAVRWFEYDTRSPGGGYEWLVSLNSRQIARVRIIEEKALLLFLALTVWNKESLVFWVPAECAGGGALFTADSDLKGVQLPALDGAIVTAPHHGSSANARVYQLINRDVIWVRSDGRFRGRPCVEYLQAQGRKFCTLCRNARRVKQPVMLLSRPRRWSRARGVKTCACR